MVEPTIEEWVTRRTEIAPGNMEKLIEIQSRIVEAAKLVQKHLRPSQDRDIVLMRLKDASLWSGTAMAAMPDPDATPVDRKDGGSM